MAVFNVIAGGLATNVRAPFGPFRNRPGTAFYQRARRLLAQPSNRQPD